MENFTFKRQTKLIFGQDQLATLGAEIQKHTDKKILLTYGEGSIKRIGLLDQVYELLHSANIEFIELGGIKPNPEVKTARQGAQLIKAHNIDFILSVGGGSVLDNSKHMALAARTDLDIWDLILNPESVKSLTDIPKIGCIITLAATGSEMNDGGVITNPEVNEKRALSCDDVVPIFAFEDPRLLFHLPLKQRQAGVCDIISHLLEAYFGEHVDNKLTDRLVEAMLLNVLDNYEKYLYTDDYEAHSNIFLTATFALNGMTEIGRKHTDWVAHRMEHEISAYTDLTHGIGLAIVHPTVLEYYYEQDVKLNNSLIKFENLAANVFKLTGENKAGQCVQKIKELFFAVAKVDKLSNVEVINYDVDISAAKLVRQGIVGNYLPLTEKDFNQIYNRML